MASTSPLSIFEDADAVLSALRSVRRGKIFRLDHPLGGRMLELADNPYLDYSERYTQEFSVLTADALRSHGSPNQNETAIIEDKLSFLSHTGTHIDAFSHWSNRGFNRNLKRAFENGRPVNAEGLSLDANPPMVGRGVLADVAGQRGESVLPLRTAITAGDLQACLERQGTALRQGDVVLVRTGAASLWVSGDPSYFDAAGLDKGAAVWLADQGVAVIGADNWKVDVSGRDQAEHSPVHQVCLVDRGVSLVENLNLEELSAAAVYEFCFILAVPRVVNGTGFPAAPLALV